MRDYRGFSYRPNYGYTLVRDGQKIHESKHVAGAVCFSDVFYHLRKYKEEGFIATDNYDGDISESVEIYLSI